jgi:hypothetical protein
VGLQGLVDELCHLRDDARAELVAWRAHEVDDRRALAAIELRVHARHVRRHRGAQRRGHLPGRVRIAEELA